MAIAPFGHVKRLFDGSYFGRNQDGEIASMPDSPSTITSRTSAAVGATKAIRRLRPDSTSALTHSTPVLVLPKPRPASNSQVRQSVAGGIWFGRAQKNQSARSALICWSVHPLSTSCRSASGSKAIEAASEFVSNIADFNRATILASQFLLFCPFA